MNCVNMCRFQRMAAANHRKPEQSKAGSANPRNCCSYLEKVLTLEPRGSACGTRNVSNHAVSVFLLTQSQQNLNVKKDGS